MCTVHTYTGCVYCTCVHWLCVLYIRILVVCTVHTYSCCVLYIRTYSIWFMSTVIQLYLWFPLTSVISQFPGCDFCSWPLTFTSCSWSLPSVCNRCLLVVISAFTVFVTSTSCFYLCFYLLPLLPVAFSTSCFYLYFLFLFASCCYLASWPQAVLDGLAEIHSVYWNRGEELNALPWLDVMSEERMDQLSPLWRALLSHARREFPDMWTDER